MTESFDLTRFHANTFGAVSTQVFAPGRVNLIGEYTDFNDGLVLPMPLPLGISIACSRNDLGVLRAQSGQMDGMVTRALNDAANGDWTDYLLGCVSVLDAPLPSGVDVSVNSTLPVGASVSSSAALEVCFLRALRAEFGFGLTDDQIARLAQQAENEFVGVQCGLMDQMVISVGAENAALLFDTQSGGTENVALIPGTAVITLHSGVTRSLKENAYNDRRASCERAAADMGVASLRGAGLDDLGSVKDADDRIKAQHVISENARVLAAVEAIKSGDAKGLGGIMYAGHKSLSEDFMVSTAKMDEMIAKASALGVLGARMTGAGFGGCIVLIADAAKADDQIRAMLAAFPDAWLVADMRF